MFGISCVELRSTVFVGLCADVRFSWGLLKVSYRVLFSQTISCLTACSRVTYTKRIARALCISSYAETNERNKSINKQFVWLLFIRLFIFWMVAFLSWFFFETVFSVRFFCEINGFDGWKAFSIKSVGAMDQICAWSDFFSYGPEKQWYHWTNYTIFGFIFLTGISYAPFKNTKLSFQVFIDRWNSLYQVNAKRKLKQIREKTKRQIEKEKKTHCQK